MSCPSWLVTANLTSEDQAELDSYIHVGNLLAVCSLRAGAPCSVAAAIIRNIERRSHPPSLATSASTLRVLPIAIGFHPAPFQIDHIIARQHGGTSTVDNLALACIHCNRFKGPNIASVDPDSGEIVRLFHPRRDIWTEHFVWDGPELKALTQIGRVTISAVAHQRPRSCRGTEGSSEEGVFGVV